MVAASGMNCAAAKKAVGQQNKSKLTGLLSGSLFACKIKKSSPKTALFVLGRHTDSGSILFSRLSFKAMPMTKP